MLVQQTHGLEWADLSPDGKLLLTRGATAFQIVDVDSGDVRASVAQCIRGGAFTGDGRRAVVVDCGDAPSVRVWDLARDTWKELDKFGSKDPRVVRGRGGPFALVWDVAGDAVRVDTTALTMARLDVPAGFHAYRAIVSSLGDVLLFGDDSLLLFKAGNAVPRAFDLPAACATSDVDPAFAHVAVAMEDGATRIIDLSTARVTTEGRPCGSVEPHELLYTNDGKHLLMTCGSYQDAEWSVRELDASLKPEHALETGPGNFYLLVAGDHFFVDGPDGMQRFETSTGASEGAPVRQYRGSGPLGSFGRREPLSLYGQSSLDVLSGHKLWPPKEPSFQIDQLAAGVVRSGDHAVDMNSGARFRADYISDDGQVSVLRDGKERATVTDRRTGATRSFASNGYSVLLSRHGDYVLRYASPRTRPA